MFFDHIATLLGMLWVIVVAWNFGTSSWSSWVRGYGRRRRRRVTFLVAIRSIANAGGVVAGGNNIPHGCVAREVSCCEKTTLCSVDRRGYVSV